eukprot:CAMPEP_0119417316 /NCGR_PEP_ID=MMETSP1335-20130426/15483_1 /TAXON_ID=259385 /ORGANISM="Chrysoculter rhomboideus, Strain RCC1486" /LENGTH=38 /DNA_ID= /DNA_START= /DNA_END= /DNA_ORIENTATION=
MSCRAICGAIIARRQALRQAAAARGGGEARVRCTPLTE